MIKRKVIVPIVLTTILGGAVYGANKVQAFNANPFADLAQIISQKFNVDQTKVQEVITQYQDDKREARQTEMKNKEEDRLSQLVSDRKITETQKQEILTKMEELQVKYQPNGMQGKTSEEKQQIMTARKAEFDAWLKSKNIDIDADTLGMGMRMGQGMGRGMGKGN